MQKIKHIINATLQQGTAKLANGQTVKDGDIAEFTDSNGEVFREIIRRDISNPSRFYFFYNTFKIGNYKTEVRIINKNRED